MAKRKSTKKKTTSRKKASRKKTNSKAAVKQVAGILTGAALSAGKKRKQGGRGKPFEPGNKYRFPPGKSGNPGGRPKPLLIREAYTAWLAVVDDETGKTHAQLLAEELGIRAIQGDVAAAREYRAATDGVKLTTDEKFVVVIDE